jgi:hypothetical protein
MTCWIATAVPGAWMEVGRNCHGFYCGITKNLVRISKVAHFIPVMTTYSGLQVAELYMSRIVCPHGVPKKIVSDRGTQFTLRF